MAVPVWVVGQVLTASDVNTWLTIDAAYKTANQSVTSSTTLVNDSDLVLPVAASAAYKVECWLTFGATSGGDIKWTWALPAGGVLLYQALHNEGGATALSNSATTYSNSDTPMAAGGSPTITAVLMKGHLATAGTSGSIQLRWAQNTSNAGATSVRAPSLLTLDRIG